MPHVVDGSKCISYLTIELKNEIPVSFQNQFKNWMFGCDTCQDVCPWNRFSTPTHEPAFRALPQIIELSVEEWKDMSEEQFKKWFRDSPLKRTKWSGIQRNLKFLQTD